MENEEVWMLRRLAMKGDAKGKLPILPKDVITHIVHVGKLGPASKLTIQEATSMHIRKEAAVELSAAVRAALARMR